MTFQSRQEQAVHTWASNSLGKPRLFVPDNYGAGREPADIAWVANRCAILMYLTAGNKSYSKKVTHNLRQLKTWTQAWKNGAQLSGNAFGEKLCYGYEDIDHIIGLSIVDGDDACCEFHSDFVERYADRKLSGCATISENIFELLTLLGASPRDIVGHIANLQRAGAPIPQSHVLVGIIDAYERMLQIYQRDIPQISGQDNGLALQVRTLKALFPAIRDAPLEYSDIAGDLTLVDDLWFCFAAAEIEANLALPGQQGRICGSKECITGIYRLRCVSGVNIEAVDKDFQKGRSDQAGLALVSVVQDRRLGPDFRMLYMNSRDGRSLLEVEVEALRRMTLKEA